jgi:hypothetical protein
MSYSDEERNVKKKELFFSLYIFNAMYRQTQYSLR